LDEVEVGVTEAIVVSTDNSHETSAICGKGSTDG
jgi:hypothetical protein